MGAPQDETIGLPGLPGLCIFRHYVEMGSFTFLWYKTCQGVLIFINLQYGAIVHVTFFILSIGSEVTASSL